jgi:septal ring factor EnvC (AmiA/AmiB activator)
MSWTHWWKRRGGGKRKAPRELPYRKMLTSRVHEDREQFKLTKIRRSPHTLPAQQLYLSHLAPSLSAHSQTMRENQDALQAENAEILDRVLSQRRQIASLMQGLETVVAGLDESVAALQSSDVDLDMLREEVRSTEEELRK